MTDPLDTLKELHADSFLRAYERCINPKDQGLSIPALICATLSAELGLKLLLCRNGRKKRGHDLKMLMNALPVAERSAIVDQLRGKFSDWSDQLEKADTAFVNWRYFYESETLIEVNIHFVGALASAINARVRESGGAT